MMQVRGQRVSTVFGIIALLILLLLITDFVYIFKSHLRTKKQRSCPASKPAVTPPPTQTQFPITTKPLATNLSSTTSSKPWKYLPANLPIVPPWPTGHTSPAELVTTGGKCLVIYGASFVGGDYSVVTVATIPACCDACSADPRCIAWTLESASCWLKDHFPGPYLIAPTTKREKYTSGYVADRQNRSAGCLKVKSTLEQRVDLSLTEVNDLCRHRNDSAYIPRRVLIFGLTHGLSRRKAQQFGEQLEQFGKMFSDYRYLIYDNDHPCSPLPDIAKNNSHIRILTEYLQMPSAQSVYERVSCGRVRWLAHLRNHLLSRVRDWLTNPFDQFFDPYQPDLLIQIDFDQMISGGIAPAVVGPTICADLLQFRGWDVLCAYGQSQGIFYDTFAVRTCEVEYYEQFNNYSIIGASALALKEAISPRLQPKMRLLPHMLRVQSCFSALSLMSVESVLGTNCSYQEGTCMCEHVPFSACLIWNGYGNIFVDTKLVVDYKNNADRKGLKPPQLLKECEDNFGLFGVVQKPKDETANS
jgi:hypothetical protein